MSNINATLKKGVSMMDMGGGKSAGGNKAREEAEQHFLNYEFSTDGRGEAEKEGFGSDCVVS
jgi:hypothetical protein